MLDGVLNLPDENDSSPLSSNISKSQIASDKIGPLSEEIEANFISAIYSSLGAPLEENSRLVFDEFVKNITGFLKFNDTPEKRATLSKPHRVIKFYVLKTIIVVNLVGHPV